MVECSGRRHGRVRGTWRRRKGVEALTLPASFGGASRTLCRMCHTVRKVQDMIIDDALMCWFNSEYTTCQFKTVLLFHLLRINQAMGGQNLTSHKRIMGLEFNPTTLFLLIHKPRAGLCCLTLTAQHMQAALASTNCNRSIRA